MSKEKKNETVEEPIVEQPTIEELQAKVEEEHNNYLRAMADADNIRKNFAKKQADLYTYQYERLLSDMLPILDDFGRALLAEPTDGMKAISQKFANVMAQYGISTLAPEAGTPFDADQMEAVSTLPNPDMTPNTVFACAQIGYMYKDKIIRYPRVVVVQ